MSSEDVWVFAYGSVMWDQGTVQPVEEKVGFLQGWHRDWTWISESRGGAPTCSLQRGGKVKGKFFRLNPKTQDADLEYFREREVRSSEEILAVDSIPGRLYFWTMGNNLEDKEDTKGLKGVELYETLAKRAKNISVTGRNGKTPKEYALAVHKFDPDDKITKTYVNELLKLSEST
jgi:hypothetical protein